MEDELLDLVDVNDQPIGTILRSEYERMATERLGNIRAVEMFIQNDEGKLWVPKRADHKRIAPGGLDYSTGGHVGAGESYEDAAVREIKEELNLDITKEDLEFVRKFEPTELPYFRVLYIYHSNVAPRYNPDDFVSAEWLSPEELIKKLDGGVPAKSSMRETVAVLC